MANIGIRDGLEAARMECERKILEAILDFSETTGLRVTNVIYNHFDTLDGNEREQSITIEVRVI